MSSSTKQRWLRLSVLTASAVLAVSCTGGDAVVASTSSTAAGQTTVAAQTTAPESTVEQTSTTESVTSTSTSTTAGSGLIDRPLSNPVTVLAVADLTDCRGPDDEVGALVRSLEGTVLMPGDLANREGSYQQFEECFLPEYGSELDRIYATPGDNDYNTPGAVPYYETLVDHPGEPGKGWYAVELGSWQLISLNTNCEEVGGCRVDSEQYEWLDALLEEEHYECRVVMWHEPRFTSSANYSGIPGLGDFYERLHGVGADILLVGHAHHYERLGPLAPSGEPSSDGIMNFTLGIGGATFTQFSEEALPGSQIQSNEHRGLVRFTLGDGGYDWEFVNVESNETDLVDRGSADC